MTLRSLTRLFFILAVFSVGPVYANCSSPAGKEADIIYNSSAHTYQFCNGTSWIQYNPGFVWQDQANNNPTYPGGVGFWVLSSGTYTGALGGLSGANSTCLTELTTNTGWKGYSTANGRSLLTSGHVKAFLCDGSTCNNLNASTTYYFANAGNNSAGGASFTTDGSGNGPNDSADWAAANYFGGSYEWWTNRASASDTAWAGSSYGIFGDSCSAFSTNANQNALFGQAGPTDGQRWGSGTNGGSFLQTCGYSHSLICEVNP